MWMFQKYEIEISLFSPGVICYFCHICMYSNCRHALYGR